jgi:hypothetical protein
MMTGFVAEASAVILGLAIAKLLLAGFQRAMESLRRKY